MANEFMTIDLGFVMDVTGVVTQGRGNVVQFVLTYALSYAG